MRYMFTFIGIAILVISFFSQKIEIKSDLINKELKEKVLPLTLEKSLTKTTINNVYVESDYNNNLKGNINLNFESPVLSFKNKETSVIFNYELKDNIIYIKVKEIDYNKLNIDSLYKESLENTKEIVNPLKDKLSNLIEKKLGTKVSEKVNNKIEKVENYLNQEKILQIIDDKIKSKDFKVYDLGLKGYFIKDIKLNILNDNKFKFDIELSLGTFGIILGSIIILLSLMKDILLGLISFYQKRISPYKGYNCARGVVSEDGTCSSIVKQTLKEKGVIAAINEYFNTTHKCKEDYNTYKDNKEYYDNKRKNNNSNNNFCDCPAIPCGGPSHSHSHDSCDCDILPCN